MEAMQQIAGNDNVCDDSLLPHWLEMLGLSRINGEFPEITRKRILEKLEIRTSCRSSRDYLERKAKLK